MGAYFVLFIELFLILSESKHYTDQRIAKAGAASAALSGLNKKQLSEDNCFSLVDDDRIELPTSCL